MVSLSSAIRVVLAAEEQFSGKEFRVSSEGVLELAATSKCSAYDCEYVALAKDIGAKLITADKQVLKFFPKIAISLQEFAR